MAANALATGEDIDRPLINLVTQTAHQFGRQFKRESDIRGGRSARIDTAAPGRGSRFCRRYGLDKLVHAEHHATIIEAIAREKAMKAWKRAWKIELIEATNPEWNDLSKHLV